MGDVTTVPKTGRALTDKVGILKRNAKLVAAEGIRAEIIKEGEGWPKRSRPPTCDKR